MQHGNEKTERGPVAETGGGGPAGPGGGTGGPGPPGGGDEGGGRSIEPQKFHIRIDRTDYEVGFDQLDAGRLTGLQLRHLPEPPIGADRDLFEIVPGGRDRKIGNDDAVVIRDWMRFFSAPATINPGDIPHGVRDECHSRRGSKRASCLKAGQGHAAG